MQCNRKLSNTKRDEHLLGCCWHDTFTCGEAQAGASAKRSSNELQECTTCHAELSGQLLVPDPGSRTEPAEETTDERQPPLHCVAYATTSKATVPHTYTHVNKTTVEQAPLYW